MVHGFSRKGTNGRKNVNPRGNTDYAGLPRTVPVFASPNLTLTSTVPYPSMGEEHRSRNLYDQGTDWKGEGDGWYVMISDSEDVQLSVQLTAPMPTEFPERRVISGVGIKYEGGHSIVIENKHPYTTATVGRPDWFVPCLSENSLRVTVDEEDWEPVPVVSAPLPGEATITAVNLPPECQPYGGDMLWAETFAKMTAGPRRRLSIADGSSVTEWAMTWTGTAAAPGWCEKFLSEAATDGVLQYRGKHAVFGIETPAFSLRVHHGTNYHGGVAVEDGRVAPELEFWQMEVHLERYSFDAEMAEGLLAEKARRMEGSGGLTAMSGEEASLGALDGFRVSGPLASDFSPYHA